MQPPPSGGLVCGAIMNSTVRTLAVIGDTVAEVAGDAGCHRRYARIVRQSEGPARRGSGPDTRFCVNNCESLINLFLSRDWARHTYACRPCCQQCRSWRCPQCSSGTGCYRRPSRGWRTCCPGMLPVAINPTRRPCLQDGRVSVGGCHIRQHGCTPARRLRHRVPTHESPTPSEIVPAGHTGKTTNATSTRGVVAAG